MQEKKKRNQRDWSAAKEKVEQEGICRNCRTNRLLTPAHLIHRGMGGNMEADNIIPLCIQCHAAYDKHELDILKLLTVDEQIAMVRCAGGIENARIRACPSQYR